jgi:chromate transport protein ChrA
MVIHIGHERAGWKGLIVASLCFILPAVIITGIFAFFYKNNLNIKFKAFGKNLTTIPLKLIKSIQTFA